MVQASRHSGMDAHWFHVSCFFKKHKNVTQAEIGKFDELKSEDQQLLAKCFGEKTFLFLQNSETIALIVCIYVCCKWILD